jgi:hypothetical protein
MENKKEKEITEEEIWELRLFDYSQKFNGRTEEAKIKEKFKSPL